MSLSEHIRKGLEKKKILLMTHVVVGYPSLEANWSMLQAMSEAEVDLVELQMPFSEPTADGPLLSVPTRNPSAVVQIWMIILH